MTARVNTKRNRHSGGHKRANKQGGIGVFRFLIILSVLVFVSLKMAERLSSPDSLIRSGVTNHMEDALSMAEKWFRTKMGLPDATDTIQRQNEDLSQMTPIKPSYVLRPPDAIEFNAE
ncbi:hypothetical protein AA14337_3207 [Acetobacter malorum DSM 14337]|uniref:Uncharacterized protein n=1 Tax=Acetobacter malorum DSM 14337 TaxID=1307910 RepID=A0ABQ0Q087_9PROT|nr:hypothetical protein AD930_11735 [Acetobacter malorum]GBQ85963.1 hypothetical protein AA14337_3207 [Acetobacter malorum DSM 14337]